MTDENRSIKQTAKSGGNITQAGRDITQGNVNIVIGIFFVVVLALAGIAWAVNVGLNQGGQTPQTENKSPTP
jgi:hypothetical protein